MKKLIVLFIFCFMFIPRVYAYDIWTSAGEDYDGTGNIMGEYNIKSGGRHTVTIVYGYDPNDAEISRIDVTISNPGGSVSSVSSYLGAGDSITGSGNNYSINVNGSNNGTAAFTLTFPTVQNVSENNVSVTATSYNSNGEQIQTKSSTFSYLVIPNLSNMYDNNYNVAVTSSAGDLEYSGAFIGKLYTQSIAAATVEYSFTPESPKTIVSYYGTSLSSENVIQPLSNGKYATNLEYGENDFLFYVSTECSRQSEIEKEKTLWRAIIGDRDWYDSYFCSPDLITISTTRLDDRSKVNTLRSLSVSGLSIAFNPDLKTYMGTVPYKTSAVIISATLTDPKSSYVDGYAPRTVNLNEGSNDVLVKVRAENGEETTYTIKITREKNDDATLKSLMVNDKEIKLKEDLLIYSVFVDNDVTTATIKAEPTDGNAKVEIDEIKELKEGSNKVNITVTSANGKKNNYVLNISRDKKISENSKLRDIIIKNHDLDFNSEILDYTLKIGKDEKKLDIEALTDHLRAKTVIIGNKDLKNNSIIKIKVTAEDGKTSTVYTIKVVKESKFNILFIIIPLGLLLIGGGVFFFIKNNKNKTPKTEDNMVANHDIPNTETVDNTQSDIPVTSESSMVDNSQPDVPVTNESATVDSNQIDIPVVSGANIENNNDFNKEV